MSHNVALSFADGKTLFIAVKPNELLLDAALRQGISLPLDCREGVCGTCQGRCEAGAYSQDYVDEEALSERDLAQRKVLACQTRVTSDAAFYFDHDSSLCHAAEPERISAQVTSVELVSATTAILHLDASAAPRQLQFLPGQYARLRIPGTDDWARLLIRQPAQCAEPAAIPHPPAAGRGDEQLPARALPAGAYP
ncbi:ferredoxin [Pseudomonas psychrotolerans]|nr:ferredoxin [Pseudomonas psychrotolerans]